MHDSNVSGFNAFGLSISTTFAAKTSFDNHLLKNLFSNQRTTSRTSKYNHLSSTSLVTKEDEEKEAEQMQHAIDNKDFLK